MADQTIIIQYVVEADEAIRKAQEFQALVDATKVTLKTLADSAGVSFKIMAKSIEQSFRSLKFLSEPDQIKLSGFLGISQADVNNAEAFAQAKTQALKAIGVATTQLGQEERAQITATKKAQQEQAAEAVRLAQATAKAIRDAKSSERQAASEYENATKSGYKVMSDAAKAYGQQVAQVKQQIVSTSQGSGQTYTQVAQQMQAAGTSVKVLNSALKELQPTAQKTQSIFGSLGQTIQQALVIGLGLNLYNALQSIIAFLREAAISGQELAKAFFQLDVGIRAVRRAGVDLTTPEMLDNLDKLNQKFGVFSKKSLVEGSAALINLVRDLGLTKEQIFELQDAIATLAVVNGRSMEEVQRTVALALASGYTEGLQRLGVSINRVNIAARANAMGWKGGYTALTEYQRAQATLSLVMEKTGKYANDLTEYLKTEAGQLDANTARMEDQAAVLGEQLLPYMLAWSNLLYTIRVGLSALISIIGVVANPFVEAFDLIYKSAQQARNETNKMYEDAETNTEKMKVLAKEWQLFAQKMQTGAADLLYKLFGGSEIGRRILGITKEEYQEYLDSLKLMTDNALGEANLGQDELADQGEKVKKLLEKLHDDIEKEQRRFNSRFAELNRDYAKDIDRINRDVARDLEKVDRDLARDLEEINRDLAKSLADVDRDLARDLTKLSEDLTNDLADIDKDYAKALDDINRDLAKDLVDMANELAQDRLDAWQDGLDKIQKEEEDFADRIDKANKDYTKKVADENQKYRDNEIKAEEDYQDKLRKMRDDYLFSLEDALRERDALQIMRLGRKYARDVSESRLEYEKEREERKKNHEQEIEDLRKEREDRQKELEEDHQERLDDIRKETQERMDELQRRYEQERAERIRKAEEDRAERYRDYEERKLERLQQFELAKAERIQRAAEEKLDREREAQEKRDERILRAAEEKKEREIRAEEEKAERKIKLQEAIAELRIESNERIKELILELANEEGITAEMLGRIAKQYQQVYGPGGNIDQIMYYFVLMLNQRASEAMTALERMQATYQRLRLEGGNNNNNNNNNGGGGRPQNPFAEGGIMYADRPTTVVFGEKGLEKAEFTPVSYTGRNEGKVVGTNMSDRDNSGKISLRVSLDPDLIGRIEEETLNRTADVLFEVQRRSR